MEVLSGRVLVRPTDPARSTAFYRDVLGLAVYREFPGGTVFFLGGGPGPSCSAYSRSVQPGTAAPARSSLPSGRCPGKAT